MIIIPNEEEFLKKKQKIISEGFSNLHFVVDYDRTMTHSESLTTYRTIETSELLSEEFRNKINELFNYYYPLEIDYHLSREERLQHMLDWWDKSHQVLLDQKFTKQKIQDIVDNSIDNIYFKKGLKELFDFCETKDVPILVLSAGIGNVIRATFNTMKWNHNNTHVISNFMDFNTSSGVADSFVGDCIHVYNKNEAPILGSLYADSIRHRRNVIVIGDSMGDSNMADGLDNECVLRIAFVSSKTKNHVDKFSEKFDVVIIEEESYDFVNELLSEIN